MTEKLFIGIGLILLGLVAIILLTFADEIDGIKAAPVKVVKCV